MTRVESWAITTDGYERRGRFAPNPPWVTVMRADWSNAALGDMDVARYRNGFGDQSLGSSTLDFAPMSVVDDAERGRVRRIDWTAEEQNPTERSILFPPIPFANYPGGFGAAKDRTMRVTDWVLFPVGYDFSAGAKLGGIGGNINGASNGQASGGNGNADLSDAVSCRWMIYSAPTAATPPGYGTQLTDRTCRSCGYVYWNGMPTSDGYGINEWHADPAPGGNFTADGEWHERTHIVRPNTVGQANGILGMYLDGVPLIERTNFVWRTNPELGFNKYWDHWFYGGSGAGWGPSQSQHMLVDGPLIEVSIE